MREPVISYKDLRVGETYTVTRSWNRGGGRNRVVRRIAAIEESPYGKRGADNTRILFTEYLVPAQPTLVQEIKSCTAKSFCKWFRRKAK